MDKISNTTFSRLLAAAVLSLCALSALPANAMQEVDFAGARASGDARYVANWVAESGDNQGLPFVIVDKKDARIFVFEPGGRLRGVAPALTGLQPGDHSVPGIGQRELSQILPHERTTPAGRFKSVPGRNLSGEQVVWIDYNAGLAIHRVRAGNPRERRQQRLDTAATEDNRISLGCVVVGMEFFETVVDAVLGRSYGVVYVLPETRPASEVFGAH